MNDDGSCTHTQLRHAALELAKVGYDNVSERGSQRHMHWPDLQQGLNGVHALIFEQSVFRLHIRRRKTRENK